MCVIIASLLTLPSLNHTLTHCLTHCLTHSLSHSLTVSLTHCLTHSLPHSLPHSLTHSLTHCLTHSLTVSFTYSLTHSFFTNIMFIIIDRYYSLKYMNKLKCFTISVAIISYSLLSRLRLLKFLRIIRKICCKI